jgi:hypothetical protein
VLVLGVVFMIRGIPGWEEPRWVVLVIRMSAFLTFLWNQVECYRFRRELRNRLALVLSGMPLNGRESML